MNTVTSRLSFFDEREVQTDIRSSRIVDYHPRTADNSGPFEFIIPGSGEEYIDLNKVDLNVLFKILKADGTNLAATDIVGFNNLGIATLFRDVQLNVGDYQIEGGQQDYAYKSYFHNVMQFPPLVQDTYMEGFGWVKDEAGKFDDAANSGFVARANMIKASKVCDLYGPIYLDFFNQPKLLISNTDLRLKFTLQKPEFLLNDFAGTPVDCKIKIEKMTLYVRRALVNPSVIKGHTIGLDRNNLHYPISHRKMLTYTIPAGQLSFRKDNLFPSESPKLIMVALVDNVAFNGAMNKNPYNFQHFDLGEIALRVNGVPHPGPPYKPHFSKGVFARDYMDLMETFGYYKTDNSNGLKMSEFATGYTIYAFDMSPDNDISSDHRSPNLSEDIRLDLWFRKALPATINVLIYAAFDSEIQISKLRDVFTDYNR